MYLLILVSESVFHVCSISRNNNNNNNNMPGNSVSVPAPVLALQQGNAVAFQNTMSQPLTLFFNIYTHRLCAGGH